MADVTIIQLDPATAPLAGTEAIPVVQGGLTVQTTAQDIANLVEIGLTIPTFAPTPSFPSNALQTYYYAPAVKVGGYTIASTKYGVYFTSLSSGPAFPFYENNKITALSTNAVVMDSFNPSSQIFDSSYTSASFPTVEALFTSFGSPGTLQIGNSNITSLNFPILKVIGGLNINVGVASINLPQLVYMDNTLNLTALVTGTPVSFPALETINSGGIYLQSFQTDSVSFPALKYVGGAINLAPASGFNTQTLNLSSLEYVNGAITIQMSNVTSLDLSSLKYVQGGQTMTFQTALDQTSVDNVLEAFAALDGTNGTTLWNYGNLQINFANAAPGAAGLAAIATLQARGVNVSYN